MTETAADEAFLLALLNTTPVADGEPADLLAGGPDARGWTIGHGGKGTAAELRELRTVRDLLQAVVRGTSSPDVLAAGLRDVVKVPAVTGGGIQWTVSVTPERALAVRAMLTWDRLARTRPGRLRPCASGECSLFLLDHSKANAARWCSMAVCGNRMKARRHYHRSRQDQDL